MKPHSLAALPPWVQHTRPILARWWGWALSQCKARCGWRVGHFQNCWNSSSLFVMHMPVKIRCHGTPDSIHHAIFLSCGLQLVFLMLETENAGKPQEEKPFGFWDPQTYFQPYFLITLKEEKLCKMEIEDLQPIPEKLSSSKGLELKTVSSYCFRNPHATQCQILAWYWNESILFLIY